MKFILFVEGHTEDKYIKPFFKKWLDGQTSQRVGLEIVRFDGWSNLADRIEKKFLHYINSPNNSEIIAVLSLLDLYGPTFYPEDKVTVSERWEWGREYMEARISNERYRHYFAVHETEAWLLAQPDLFDAKVKNVLLRQKRKPEEVNTKEPPAKLLNKLYQSYLKRSYHKTVDGRNLFHRADPIIAAEACPYLNVMLMEMQEMAQAYLLR